MGFSIFGSRIILTRGDSVELVLTITNPQTGEPFVPGGEDQVYFTVKKTIHDREPVIQKTLDHGIVRNEDSISILLDSADTADLSYGIYKYDVELVTVSGYTDTVVPPGLFIVTEEVTTHEPSARQTEP